MGRQSGIILVCFVVAHVALVLVAISLSTHYWIHGKTHYHINVTTHGNGSSMVLENHTENNHTGDNHTVNNHTLITMFNVTRRCSKGFWKLCCEEESHVWYIHTSNHTTNFTEVVKIPVYVLHSNDTKNHSVNWTGCHQIDIFGNNSTNWIRGAMICCCFSVANLVIGNVLFYVFLLVTRFKRSFPVVAMKTGLYLVATAELVASIILVNMHHHEDPDIGEAYESSLGWSLFVALAAACVGTVTAVSSLGLSIMVKANTAPYETLSVSS